MLTIEDLLPIREYPEIAGRRGTLKKAEILIRESKLTNGCLTRTTEDSATHYTGVYLIGNLQENTEVRTAQKQFFIDIPLHLKRLEWTQFVDQKRAQIRESMPIPGQALPVYWFSKEPLPSPFKGTIYVKAIGLREEQYAVNPLCRSEKPTPEYLAAFETFNPLEDTDELISKMLSKQ